MLLMQTCIHPVFHRVCRLFENTRHDLLIMGKLIATGKPAIDN